MVSGYRCCNQPIQKDLAYGAAHEGTRNDHVEIKCDLRMQPEPTLQNLFHLHTSKNRCFLERWLELPGSLLLSPLLGWSSQKMITTGQHEPFTLRGH